MITKTDRRENIRKNRDKKWVHHWMWAWKPSYIHLRKVKKIKS